MTQTSVCLSLLPQTVDKHIVICFIYVCVFRKGGIAQIVNCFCQMLVKDLLNLLENRIYDKIRNHLHVVIAFDALLIRTKVNHF